MNKHDFIDKMLVKFMSNAKTEQAKQAEEEYEQFLKSTFDFDYLYEKVCTEYNLRSIPLISWLKQHYRTSKEYKSDSSNLYWTALFRTKLGDYEFPIEMKYTEQQVADAYRRKLGWQYLKGNRRQVMLENGLA